MDYDVSLLLAGAFFSCKGTVHSRSATLIPVAASSFSYPPPSHLRFLLVLAKLPCERNKIILKSIIWWEF